jgi:hypothetical protein
MVICVSKAGGVLDALYVVATPLAVAAGDTEPHGGEAQSTFQLTPLLVGSLLTTAVICAVPPARMVLALELKVIVTFGGGGGGLLSPPQALKRAIRVIAANMRSGGMGRITRTSPVGNAD